MTTRRRALQGIVSACALAHGAAALAVAPPRDRVTLLRHASVLLELAGRRVLFEPSLEPSFSAQGLVSAPPSALAPAVIGPLDVVVITSGEPWSFDARTLKRLDLARARVLVPDEATARRARRFAQRVRVVRPGEVTTAAGLVARASPARGVLGAIVPGGVAGASFGLHLSTPGSPAVWHTGHLPPLDVDAAVVPFSRAHAADVVLGSAWGVSLRVGGPALVSSLDDTRVLAGLCGARVIVPLGVGAQAPTPSGLFQFVWRAEAARPSGHEPIPLATLEPGRSYVLPPASR